MSAFAVRPPAACPSQIFLFDAKTGEKVGEMAGHAGAIFSCSWSPDGTKLLTASADKTVRIWDVEARTNSTYARRPRRSGTSEPQRAGANAARCSPTPKSRPSIRRTFTLGNTVDDQQLGCLWQGQYKISVSLSGDINYLDESDPSKPTRVVRGHAKPITAAAIGRDKTFFTGDAAGRICAWSLDDGAATPFSGNNHTNQASALGLQGSTVVSTGMDDTVRFTPIETKVVGDDIVKSDTQPRTLATHDNGTTVLAAIDKVHVISGGKVVSTVADANQAYSVAIAPSGTEVAVGQTDAIQLYALADGQLTATARLTGNIRGQITALAYSPDGKYLAAGDAMRQVVLFDTATQQVRRPPSPRPLAAGGGHTDRSLPTGVLRHRFLLRAGAPVGLGVPPGARHERGVVAVVPAGRLWVHRHPHLCVVAGPAQQAHPHQERARRPGTQTRDCVPRWWCPPCALTPMCARFVRSPRGAGQRRRLCGRGHRRVRRPGRVCEDVGDHARVNRPPPWQRIVHAALVMLV